MEKWRYSFLQPYYKQGQKAGKESQATGVLGRAAASSDHESDEDPNGERAHESSSSATRKETPEHFGSLDHWPLHLPSAEPRREPENQR